MKYLIREYYPFGLCPTYRDSETGEVIYHFSVYDAINDRMTTHIVNYAGLVALLREYWCPVAYEDVSWFERNVAAAMLIE